MKRRSILKCAAVLLAALFVLQSGAAVLGAPSGAGSYTGTVLAAINTDYMPSRTGKTFETESSVNAQAQTDPADAQASKQPWELAWEQFEPMTPAEAAQALAAQEGTVEAQRARTPYSIGDKRTIPGYPELPDDFDTMTLREALKWFVNYARNVKTQLTCVYTDDVCTVWIEDENAWTDEYIREVGGYVGTIIPQVEDLFGNARIDTDKDGKFAIFVHSMPQSETVMQKQGGTAVGYFSPSDLLDSLGRIGSVWMKSQIAEALSTSAHADCFHLNMICTDLDDIKVIFPHEYQHYIHQCYLYDGKNNRTYLEPDEMYINEGFAVASETILNPGSWMQDHLLDIFNNPVATDNPNKLFSLVTWDEHMVNYGLVYPFFQYIRTRYAALTGDTDGAFPGKGIYKRVLESRDRSNQDNTLGVIADILYPADRYASLPDTDARCRQLIEDFWMAVFFKKPQGDLGFNGEAWAEKLCVPTNDLSREQTLRNGMAMFYLVNNGERDTVKIVKADDSLRFFAVDEAVRSVTLDPNGGHADVRTVISIQTRYTLPKQENETLFREGYTFSGWASSPDAEAPEYKSGETIPLKSSVILYAVWMPAEQIETGRPYSFGTEGGGSLSAQFTPTEDGVYYLDCGRAFQAKIYAPDQPEGTLNSPDDGVFLYAGTTYTFDLTFDSQSGDGSTADSYTLRLRAAHYTLRYYTEWSADTDPNDWYLRQQFGTTYTVCDCDILPDGKDFGGWSTKPNDTNPMYLPGDPITIDRDTDLYAVWILWDALQTDVPYTVGVQSGKLRFVPDKTAVYRFKAKASEKKYEILLFSEADAIDDSYTARTQSRTYTMYAGHTYYLYTENISSLCMELVSEKLQHSLVLYVSNGLEMNRIKTLSVEMTGSNTYVLPDYRPVSLGFSSFEFWLDPYAVEPVQYYPGDTVTLDRDVVLYALSTQAYPLKAEYSSIAAALGDVAKMTVSYFPVWFRCFFQRVKYFGLSHMFFSIPWLAD